MEILKFQVPKHFTNEHLKSKIAELSKKNQHENLTRIRLTVFRGDCGLYDAENNFPNYLIETWSIEDNSELNSNGLEIDIYPEAHKSCDRFANIKSNNFLPYVMAAIYAKGNKLNDCVLLNSYGRICDTIIANIFLIKGDVIYTPPLAEGCIMGVTRSFIIEKLNTDFKIVEKPVSVEELKDADEVFLTNSIKGIRWVKQFQNKQYTNNKVKQIHQLFLKTIY